MWLYIALAVFVSVLLSGSIIVCLVGYVIRKSERDFKAMVLCMVVEQIARDYEQKNSDLARRTSCQGVYGNYREYLLPNSEGRQVFAKVCLETGEVEVVISPIIDNDHIVESLSPSIRYLAGSVMSVSDRGAAEFSANRNVFNSAMQLFGQIEGLLVADELSSTKG